MSSAEVVVSPHNLALAVALLKDHINDLVRESGTPGEKGDPGPPGDPGKQGKTGRKGDKGDPGTFLLEVEYDDGSPWAFNPQGVVCDGDGQPTTKTVEIDHILVPIFCLRH